MVEGKGNERGRDLQVQEPLVKEEVNLRAWWQLGRRDSNRMGGKELEKGLDKRKKSLLLNTLVALRLRMQGKTHLVKVEAVWLTLCPS